MATSAQYTWTCPACGYSRTYPQAWQAQAAEANHDRRACEAHAR